MKVDINKKIIICPVWLNIGAKSKIIAQGCINNDIDYLLFNFGTETQSYVLNFHGRVTQASVKNFQLIDEKDGEQILPIFCIY